MHGEKGGKAGKVLPMKKGFTYTFNLIFEHLSHQAPLHPTLLT